MLVKVTEEHIRRGRDEKTDPVELAITDTFEFPNKYWETINTDKTITVTNGSISIWCNLRPEIWRFYDGINVKRGIYPEPFEFTLQKRFVEQVQAVLKALDSLGHIA